MSREQRNKQWINPLLTQLKLVREPQQNGDTISSWSDIEASRLPERVGKIAAEINEEAGYHLLETLFYLPPQRNVLRVRFDRNRVKHTMEMTIRDNQVRLKFFKMRHFSFSWERYFSSDPQTYSPTLIWEQIINPTQVLEEHIQSWLTYLLSELSKEFRPDTFSSSSGTAESDLSAVLRKASA